MGHNRILQVTNGESGRKLYTWVASIAIMALALAGSLFVPLPTAHAEDNTASLMGTSDTVFKAYVRKGEWLHVDGGFGSGHTVSIKGPRGETFNSQGIRQVTEDGVWTAQFPTAANEPTWWTVRVRADNVGANPPGPVPSGTQKEITGRVWTDKWGLYQPDASYKGEDISVWIVNDTGIIYKLDLLKYFGAWSLIVASANGNSTANCTPAYKSIEYDQGNASNTMSQLPTDPCGGQYRIFFNPPDAALPAQAISPSGVIPVLPAPLDATSMEVKNLKFTPSSATSMAGTFTYSMSQRFTGSYYLEIDADKNGVYTGTKDRRILLGANGAGSYTTAFDGKDAQGNAISATTGFNARITFDKVGEVHITQWDVERRGGLRLTQLNGSGMGVKKLYWDDTQLTEARSTQPTPTKNGLGGYDSSSGTHGWSWVSTAPTVDDWEGAKAPWGNDRIIDDWTYASMAFSVDLPTTAGLTLDKKVTAVTDTNTNGKTDAGDTIRWAFDVTNSGQTAISNVGITDAFLTSKSITTTCSPATLDPGAKATCTTSGAYAITQNDVNTLTSIDNSARATGTSMVGPVTSNTDTTSTPLAQAASLTLDKISAVADKNSNSKTDAGDTITYTFKVTNTGTQTVTGVGITDAFLASKSITTTCSPTTLAAGATVTCTATGPYTITTADVNTGTITNTATATAKSPSNATVTSNQDTETTTLAQSASIALDKRVKTVTDSNANGKNDKGDTITYEFGVTNTGNVALSGIAVQDSLLAAKSIAVTCNPATLAAGATVTCTAPAYAITQADVNAGSVTNVATASGTPPAGAAVTSPPDQTTTAMGNDAALTIDKRVTAVADTNTNTRTDAGDTITYAFDVTNTGAVTLTNIRLTDATLTALGITTSCTPTALDPGQTVTCTASKAYPITQADVDAGSVTNTASATGDKPAGGSVTSLEDSVTTDMGQNASVSLVKTVKSVTDTNSNTRTDAGDTITYGFTVTNTGSVTLKSIAITDAPLTAAGITTTCTPTTLAPSQAATCTASKAYPITQAHVDAGSVTNTATATGITPKNNTVTSLPAEVTTELGQGAALTLDKRVVSVTDTNKNTTTDAGDTITYGFTVTNTGSVTVSGVGITDGLLTGTSITCTPTVLAPGAQATCAPAAAYVIKQSDVDAGSVTNVATAAGTNPKGDPVTSAPDETTTETGNGASLLLDKKVAAVTDTNTNSRTDAGDRIVYGFDVTNTGAVTVKSIEISDPALTAAGITTTCAPAALAPNQTAVCTASKGYTITQADADAGSVTNIATARGLDPKNAKVTSNEDDTTTTIGAVTGLGLVKRAKVVQDVNTNGHTDAGDTVTYEFEATNSGGVTLSGIAITDALLGAAGITTTCTPTTLAPGAAATCSVSGPYVMTQADADAGSVTNTATAGGMTPKNNPVTSAPASVTTTTGGAATLTIDKTVKSVTDTNTNSKTDRGDTISYGFEVTNTGSVTLKNIRITDPALTAAGITTSCTPTTLAPSQTATCAASKAYAITQTDADAGSVTNTATATGDTPANNPVTSPQDSVTTTIGQDPALTVAKKVTAVTDVNTNSITDAGDLITYAFEVTNSGSVTMSGITINDSKLTGAITCTPTTLTPSQVATCTAAKAYTITQADADAGSVTNVATATGQDPKNKPVTSPEDSVTTTTGGSAALTLVKRVNTVVDTGSNGKTDAGDTIEYLFDVTNAGSVTVTGITLADPMLSAAGIATTCTPTTLAPGQVATCTASKVYTITQANVDAGSVTNVATASGTNPANKPVTSPPSEVTTATGQDAALTLDKRVTAVTDTNTNSRVDAGDQIGYAFDVTNTGSVTVTGLAINDSLLKAADITCAPTTVAPSQTATCTGTKTYTITQADVDAGSVTNLATARGLDPKDKPVDSPEDSVTTETGAAVGLTLTKKVSAVTDVNTNEVTDTADTIAYTFDVTNAGAVTLHGLTIADPMLTAAGITTTCTPTTLAPSQVATCVASTGYAITQANVDAGSVTNTATAHGLTPKNNPAESAPDSVTTNTGGTPGLAIDKRVNTVTDANDNGKTDKGDTIRYEFNVTNTGAVTVSGVTVNDPALTAAGITTTCTPAVLAPGATAACATAKAYTITQADVDAGSVTNVATAQGLDPKNKPVTSPEDEVTTETGQDSGLGLVKKVTAVTDVNTNSVTDAGDQITYAFDVTNTGAVTVSGVTVNDPALTAAGITTTCTPASLAPSQVATCTAAKAYTITQADADAGSVTNVATAQGLDPKNKPVTSPEDSVTTATGGSAALTIAKRVKAVTDTGSNGKTDAGDTIEYLFDVTNAGAVTVKGITVTDPLLAPATVACTPTALAPGQVASCTASSTYTITQANVDAGSVTNVATASGTDPKGKPVTSPPGEATTATGQDAALTLDKRVTAVTDTNTNSRVDAGDHISYAFDVTNTGAVTVTDLTIDDPLLDGTGIPCAPTTVAPGQVATCTAAKPYVITQGDVDFGTVVNTATAHGKAPKGKDVASPPGSVSTEMGNAVTVTLDKRVTAVTDVNTNAVTDTGDLITYEFEVTNAGAVTLHGLTIADPMLTAAGITTTCTPTSLAPSQTATCVASKPYAITQANTDAGSVTNTATAHGLTPKNNPAESAPDSVTTNTGGAATLTIDKRATVTDTGTNGKTDKGDTISYKFDVTNTGGVTLTGIRVDDPALMAAGITTSCVPATLAPSEKVTCTASKPYTITQADVDAGSVTNAATAAGTDPKDKPVTSPKDEVTTQTGQEPGLTLVKKVASVTDSNANTFTDAGDVIRYTFEVTNSGSVTVRGLTVDDPALTGAIPCAPTTLAPGQASACTPAGGYVITQADTDAGSVTNTATAHAVDPKDKPVKSPTSKTTTPTGGAPALALDKTVKTVTDTNKNDAVDAGDHITYEFAVTNTGPVTISGIEIHDPMLGSPITCEPTTLAPGRAAACTTAAYRITQADVDAGSVTNTATARGTDPSGKPVTSPEDSVTTTMGTDPALAVDKVVLAVTDTNGNSRVDAKDTISYGFEVTNTGAVTVTDIKVNDPMLGAAGITTTCTPTALAPSQAATCSTSKPYGITQADVDAGSVQNTATASGKDPRGKPVDAPEDSVTTQTGAQVGLVLVKAASVTDVNANDRTDAGDTIGYTFEVTNTGAVTLSGIRIDDPMLTGAQITTACTPATLAPSQTATCTATTAYTITQDDVDAGSVMNVATAHGVTPQGNPAASPQDSVTTPVGGTAALVVDKRVNAVTDTNTNEVVDAGDTIRYEFEVTNTGAVTVSGVSIEDPMATAAGITSVCTPTVLAPGQKAMCATSGAYTITQADVDAGSVTNAATAAGADPKGKPVVSPPDQVTTAMGTGAGLALDKLVTAVTDVNSNGRTDAGDHIGYAFTVTNTGAVTVTGISINDPVLKAAGITTMCTPTTLAPSQAATCTASKAYVITQYDADAGFAMNAATAHGTDPKDKPVDSPPDQVTTVMGSDAGLVVDKSVVAVTDANNNETADAGDTVTYGFTVTNTGAVTVTGITIDDPLLKAAGITTTCTPVALAPSQAATCTTSKPYEITQADVDAGEIRNVATASGKKPDGNPIQSPDDEATVTTGGPALLTLDKKVASTADADHNKAMTTGDSITYEFEVTNTGPVTVRDVVINDPVLTAAGISTVCVPAALAPGQVATCAASGAYVVTQADVDAGSVTNTATAHGTAPGDKPVTSNEDTVTVPMGAVAALTLDKAVTAVTDVNHNGATGTGDHIGYGFVVTNTGSVTLSGIGITDPLLGAGAIPCAPAVLAPAQEATCTATDPYVVTQADTDAGAVTNTATAHGTPPAGAAVTSGPSSTTTELGRAAALSLEKTAKAVTDVNTNGRTDAGDTIGYAFKVTNTGAVTMHDVAVADPMLAAAGIEVLCAPMVLAPGQVAGCQVTGPYTITQKDVDAQAVTNTATAVATPPRGGAVTSEPDSVTTDMGREATITLDKKIATTVDTTKDGVTNAGDHLFYVFDLVNTGAVTLSDVQVKDPMLAGENIDIACESTVLAPGQGTHCVAGGGHVITAAEVTAGEVRNVAWAVGTALAVPSGPSGTASGTPDPSGTATPNGPSGNPGNREVLSAQDSVTTQLRNVAGLALEKRVNSVTDANKDGATGTGDTLSYGFTVTNTGTVAVKDMAVADPMLAAVGITVACTPATIAPGASATCTTSHAYTITQKDTDAGKLTNKATVTGVRVDTGAKVNAAGEVTTKLGNSSSLALIKSVLAVTDVNKNRVNDTGDTINYGFKVTNTGAVTVTGLAINDPLLRGVPITCQDTTVAPSASTMCTAQGAYVITASDVKAKNVVNTATATGKRPNGATVTSATAEVSTTVTAPVVQAAAPPPLAVTGAMVGTVLVLALLIGAGGIGLLTARRRLRRE